MGATAVVGKHIKHIAVLDGVRAASIMLVLAGHMLPLGPSQFGVNGMAAHGGMALFFILSGFLICSFLLKEPPISDFLMRRFVRIVPAVTLYILVVYVLIDFQPGKALATGLYAANYLDGYLDGLNGHLWSLCVEMHFYLFAALIAALFGRRGLILFAVALVAVTAVRLFEGVPISIKTHLRVDEILAGSVLALFHHGYFGPMEKAKRLLGRALPATLALWIIGLRPETGLFYFRAETAMLLVGSILYLDRGFIRTVLESAPLRYVATISYALYIWHFFTIGYGMNEGSDIVRYLIKRPLSFAALLAIAHVSTFYYEKPVSTFVRNRFATRARTAAAAE